LINVKNEYTVAIETALGGSLQNIIVNDESVAKRCISLLKENKAGRATFLPITSVKARKFDNAGLSEMDGYISMANELVKTDDRYSEVIKSLLGNVCVCENIDLASVIAKKFGYKFKIVTLDGQIVNAGGSYTGGSISKSTGILSRKNEIDQIQNDKEELSQKLKDLEKQVEMLSQETAKYSADIDGLKEQLGGFNNDCVRFESEIKRVSEFVQQYEKQLDEIDLTIQQLKAKIAVSQKEIEKASDEISLVDKEIIDWEAKLTSSQSEQVELKKKREALSDELSELRIKAAGVAKDEEACKLSIQQIQAVIENSSDENSKLELSVTECKEQIQNKKDEITSHKDFISNSVSRIESLNGEIAQCQKKHLEYDASANALRNKFKNKMDEKENLSTQITRTEERCESVKDNFDKLVSQLWDEYELTRTDAAQIAVPINDLDEANKHLTELRSKIKNLGNVNLGAIEEYAEVSERYEFMSHQLEDVNSSKKELEDMIDQLTDNMKSMFIQTFDVINTNFKKIFAELFGGGTAELILTDPENVLECGIDINAQPPGKVITNLLSLSGGEQSLVAISIYFAILKHSPSPFCLLDEIEAALDDTNVVKYAQYLHRLTDKTQFIAITHRRGTMEEADMLYGVTMQDKGVSRLLAMSGNEVKQMKLD
ncbi:MAG: chromosome segregation protein SMC, partial [Ruminococcus sp.]|nr:chromosome segregation protein SMC [Ruminococcus sp.]